MLKEVRASLYAENGKTKLNILLNVLIVVVVLVLSAEIYFTSNYSGVYVVHDSMRPTLIGAYSDDVIGGDYIYINKNAKPDYGDVVVVNHKTEGCLIKRAVAFGGDSVRLVEGCLQIKKKGTTKFESVSEPYVFPDNNDGTLPKNTYPHDREGNLVEEGYIVPEGHFFLLGDNRNVSKDSRELGSFPLSSLDGVVTDWSLKHKSFCTALHSYFKFKLPSYFGLR